MTLDVRKERRDIVQRDRFGVVRYLQQVWTVSGLPLASPELSDQDVIDQARQWEAQNSVGDYRDRIPAFGESRLGIPIRYIRVDQVSDTGSERRIIATWGSRFTVFPVTSDFKIVPGGIQTIIQPYIVVTETGDPPVSFIQTKYRNVYRGRFQYYIGSILGNGPTSLTQDQILNISMSNVNKLYEFNNTPGIPILHKGVQFVPWRSGQTWIWTIFEGTGWVKAQLEDQIEEGSLPVPELQPHQDYVEQPDLVDGTIVRIAEDIYDIGDDLQWV